MKMYEFFQNLMIDFLFLAFISHIVYKMVTFRVKGELHEKLKRYSLFQKSLFYLTAIFIILIFVSLVIAGTLYPE